MKTHEIHFTELQTGTRIIFRTSPEHAHELIDYMLDQTVRAAKELAAQEQPALLESARPLLKRLALEGSEEAERVLREIEEALQ